MPRLIAAAVLAAFLIPLPAFGQMARPGAVCGERGKFLTHLGQNHKETPAAMGVTASGRVLEVLTSEDGTWTIIITHPNGVTCMVAAGQAWEAVEQTALEPNT